MTSFWRTREISLRLSEARRARRQDDAEYDVVSNFIDSLPGYLAHALADHLNGEELLTLTPKDEW